MEKNNYVYSNLISYRLITDYLHSTHVKETMQTALDLAEEEDVLKPKFPADFISMRDTLITVLTIKNIRRALEMSSMTMAQLKAAKDHPYEAEDGNKYYCVYCTEHKTGTKSKQL